LLLTGFVLFNFTGCFYSDSEDNSSSIVDDSDGIVVTKKVSVKNTVDSDDNIIVISVECKDSDYSEIADDIEQLKDENASYGFLEILNVENNDEAKRTKFELQITEEQLKLLVSEIDEEESVDVNASPAQNKAWYSEKQYHAIGTHPDYKTFACWPGPRMVCRGKNFKCRTKALAAAAVVYYYPKGGNLHNGKKKSDPCK